MCQSKADGGLRCAAHTRGPFGRAKFGTPGWEKAAVAYATTSEGAAVMEACIDQAIRRGDPEREAMFRVVLGQAGQQREVAGEVRSQVRSEKAAAGLGSGPGPGKGFPTANELGTAFMSTTSRKGLVNRMYWDTAQSQVDRMFSAMGIEPVDCRRWVVLVERRARWSMGRRFAVKSLSGPWHVDAVDDGLSREHEAVEHALNDLIPSRMPQGQVLQVNGFYDVRDDLNLSLQPVTWAQ